MRFSHKLTTALALLGLHGAAGDDLCAPASTSAARRVYAVARRAPLTASPPTQLSAASASVLDRGADGRADRAGLVRYGVKFNVAFKTRDIAN